MSQGENEARVGVVDSLAHGFITKERAGEIAIEFPEIVPLVAGWIQQAADAQDWRRVERLANLAARFPAPGLGAVLTDLLDANIPELNTEDVVDILGEIREVAAADSLFRVVERSIESDSPAYWLSQKAIGSLSDLKTNEANDHLRAMTDKSWPDPIRWHAAVALGIEDELGFDEDEMLK